MANLIKTYDDVAKVIRAVDKDISRQSIRLPGKIPLVLAGGSAILFAYKGKRTTHDVDIVQTPDIKGLGTVLGKLHIVSDSIACFHPDYLDRIQKKIELTNITVYTLHPLDIAITKTARGLGKDFYDLYVSDLFLQIDTGDFVRLYKEGMSYWIGNEKQFQINLDRAVEIAIEKQLLARTDIIERTKQKLKEICINGMIQEQAKEVLAIEYILEDDPGKRHTLLKVPGVVESAIYLLNTAGESVTDTAEEVAMAGVLRNHFVRLSGEPSYDAVKSAYADRFDFQNVDAASLLKLFKTLSTGVIDLKREKDLLLTNNQAKSPGIDFRR